MNDLVFRAIYCDDIRVEVGGKLSLMGVYNGEAAFHSFPATLPKLCVQIHLLVKPEDRPRTNLTIKLLNGDIELASASLDPAILPSKPEPEDLDDFEAEQLRFGVGLTFVLSPLQIVGPMRLTLRADFDGQEIKGNGLNIRLMKDSERAATMGAHTY